MMYEKFQQELKKKVEARMPEWVEISITHAVKNNGCEKVGIMFRPVSSDIASILYIDEIYARFQKGKYRGIEEAASEITNDVFQKYLNFDGDCAREMKVFFSNFDVCKDSILFKLINTELNRELLENVPHVQFYDMSLVFYILVESSYRETFTMQIYNEHVKEWGITEEYLLKVARENSDSVRPAEFLPMTHVIENMLASEKSEDNNNLFSKTENEDKDVMYVLTNADRVFGAACIVYPRVLETIGTILKENFYILPSSIHETIIVPESRSPEQEELNEIIQEINEMQLEPEEILGNHAYFYNRETKELVYGE